MGLRECGPRQLRTSTGLGLRRRQSCGGVPECSAGLDPRAALTGIINSGLINAGNTTLFEKLHAPVGFFLGAPLDIAYENVRSMGQ